MNPYVLKAVTYIKTTSTLEKFKDVQRLLRGNKTHLFVVLCGLTDVLYSFHYIDIEQRLALLKLFGGGGVASFCSKLNRMANELKVTKNILLRKEK